MFRNVVKVLTRSAVSLNRTGLDDNGRTGGTDEDADDTFAWPTTFATSPPNDSFWTTTPHDHNPNGDAYESDRFAALADEERDEALAAQARSRRGGAGLSGTPYTAPWGTVYDGTLAANIYSHVSPTCLGTVPSTDNFNSLPRGYQKGGGFHFFEFSTAGDIEALIDPENWAPVVISELVLVPDLVFDPISGTYVPTGEYHQEWVNRTVYRGYQRALARDCMRAIRMRELPIILGAVTTHPGRTESLRGRTQPGTTERAHPCRVRNINGVQFTSLDDATATTLAAGDDYHAYVRRVLEHAYGEMLAMI
jgi:hypothetical protein